MACGRLVPQPGIKHVSSALAGRLWITGPPGKFPFYLILIDSDLDSHMCRVAATRNTEVVGQKWDVDLFNSVQVL